MNKNTNILEKCPIIANNVIFNQENSVLCVENKGFFNLLAQKILNKPKTTYIQLDEFGDFVFSNINGKNALYDIANAIKCNFGEKAEPLNERLTCFFQTLENYGFIEWK